MIRSFDEEDDTEYSLFLLLRNKEYKNEIYQINEEIKHNKNVKKLYGYNKERNLNVVINTMMNISFDENPKIDKRLLLTIKLIEENKLLVENLWMEKKMENNYILYLSELTNSIYRNEYNLITLNNFENTTQNTYKENIKILISIVEKMLYFQAIDFSHLNIHPNNIYINIQNNNIYFGPPQLIKNYSYDVTYLWYSSPESHYLENEIWENNIFGNYNDIWSLGCIICEMFFINFPIFQAYSPNEKILKIIKILGLPDYKDVDYLNKYQYDSLIKRSDKTTGDNNLEEYLLTSKEDTKSNLYNFKIELINIIKGCFKYNIKNRMSLNQILDKLKYLNNNISTRFPKFPLKEFFTFNNTEESRNSNNKLAKINATFNTDSNNNNNLKYKKILTRKIQYDNGISKFKYNNSLDFFTNNNEEEVKPKIKFNQMVDYRNNRSEKYKSHKNFSFNRTDITNTDERLKKIINNYNNEIQYGKYSKIDGSKLDDFKCKKINYKKNNLKYKKDDEHLEERDEYKELQKSKLYYNYNFLYLYRN